MNIDMKRNEMKKKGDRKQIDNIVVCTVYINNAFILTLLLYRITIQNAHSF